MLWLDDLELNQLYPIAVPKDAILLEVDDKEPEGHKTPVLPPLKAASQKVDIVPCRKLSPDIGGAKEVKLVLPEKSK